MALQKNKVKFGLNKVHWAKITAWSEDGVPTFATPVRLPGAVSLSIDANGENDNFYADNTVYYVINNMPVTMVISKLHSSPPTLQRQFSVSSLTARVFSWSATMRRPRSLLLCLNLTETRTISVMCCIAARHPVLLLRVRLPRRASLSRRRHSASRQRRSRPVW